MKIKLRKVLLYLSPLLVGIVLSLVYVNLTGSFQKKTKTEIKRDKYDIEKTFIVSSQASSETTVSRKTVAEKTDFSRKIIKAKTSAQTALVEDRISSLGGEIISTKDDLIVARIPKETEEEVKQDLKEEDLVDSVGVDYPTFITADTIDWGVNRIGAPEVWDTTQASGVRVGVIDTGIDYNHPELQSRYVSGYDFVNEDSDPMDDHGHGTHVSGIIASSLNDTGTAGVSPESGIYALKVLSSDGSGYISYLVEAIDWAIDNNLQIINLSLGTTHDSEILQDKLQEAVGQGIISVAAAGNTDGGSLLYPAAYSSVISVSATDSNDNFAGFSSVGAELAAPGVSINSTVPGGGYASWSGTSMASPHVASTIALMVSNGQENIRQGLHDTALDLGVTGKDPYYGYGLVQSNPATLGEDVLAPVVTFLSPDNQSVVNGEVRIKLDVQDESELEEVSLYINGNKVKQWTEEPYEYLWQTDDIAEGDYLLVGQAVDEYDNQGKVKIEVTVGQEENTPTPIPTEGLQQGESEQVREDTEQEQAEQYRKDKENIPDVTNINQRNPQPSEEPSTEAEVSDQDNTEETNQPGIPEDEIRNRPTTPGIRVRGAKTFNFIQWLRDLFRIPSR